MKNKKSNSEIIPLVIGILVFIFIIVTLFTSGVMIDIFSSFASIIGGFLGIILGFLFVILIILAVFEGIFGR